MRLSFQIDDMTINRIVEQRPLAPLTTMLPGLAAEVLAEKRFWLQPWALDAEDRAVLAIQFIRRGCFQANATRRSRRCRWPGSGQTTPVAVRARLS